MPSLRPSVAYAWRGSFANQEVNELHAEAFGTEVFDESEWNWQRLTERHSLGWVTARRADRLVGFVNVAWDGLVHAWIQDLIVACDCRRQGIGVGLVQHARDGTARAGCEYLHVDFEEDLRPFYIDMCGFEPASAGLMRLQD